MSTNGRFKKYIIDAVISVKDEIDNNPLSQKGITQIVLDAGIGKNLLQKAFKQIAGCSMKEYRLNKRMEIAKEMLEEGRLTIKQIAHKVGYKTPGNFSAIFKIKFGFAPIEFQSHYNEAI